MPTSPQQIVSQGQIDQLIDASTSRPQVVFKHSPTCPISRQGWSQFGAFLRGDRPEAVDTWWIDVLAHRSLSRALAERIGVRHESPQVLLISSGACTWHASHFDISAAALAAALTPAGTS